jgi:hypothetical protein
VYVGEEEDGITATKSFFEELKRNWFLLEKVEVNSHDYVCDFLFVFRRR